MNYENDEAEAVGEKVNEMMGAFPIFASNKSENYVNGEVVFKFFCGWFNLIAKLIFTPLKICYDVELSDCLMLVNQLYLIVCQMPKLAANYPFATIDPMLV